MATMTPLSTGAVGVSAAGAGAFIAWLVGAWHGGIPAEAAGFLGAFTLMIVHAIADQVNARWPVKTEGK